MPASEERPIAELSREELLTLLEAQGEAGIRIAFPGKGTARQLARRVRPRVSRNIAKYSVGSAEDQAQNLVIEGDNLQAMTTLYSQRGQVDLILTDPPYNTGTIGGTTTSGTRTQMTRASVTGSVRMTPAGTRPGCGSCGLGSR